MKYLKMFAFVFLELLITPWLLTLLLFCRETLHTCLRWPSLKKCDPGPLKLREQLLWRSASSACLVNVYLTEANRQKLYVFWKDFESVLKNELITLVWLPAQTVRLSFATCNTCSMSASRKSALLDERFFKICCWGVFISCFLFGFNEYLAVMWSNTELCLLNVEISICALKYFKTGIVLKKKLRCNVGKVQISCDVSCDECRKQGSFHRSKIFFRHGLEFRFTNCCSVTLWT